MAEGSDGSGSEMGIEVDGGRGVVWCSAEDQRSKSRRKREKKCNKIVSERKSDSDNTVIETARSREEYKVIIRGR